MSLILSGTDGLSDVDGTAATPAIRGTDANTGIFFPAADTIAFAEGGAEVARFDSSGKFGIGTASPVTNLSIGNGGGGNNLGVSLSRGATTNFYEAYDGTKTFLAGVDSSNDAIKIGSLSSHPVVFVAGNSEKVRIDTSGNLGIGTTTTDPYSLGSGGKTLAMNCTTAGTGTLISMASAGSARGYFYANDTEFRMSAYTAIPIIFKTSDTERARIDSSGNLLVGTTSSNALSNNDGVIIGSQGGTYKHVNGTASGTYYAGFIYNTSIIGSISQNGTANVAYSTSSDYRLKNSISPMIGALAKIALLKPCTYKWNSDGSDGQGFIAHELAEVCPDAVIGEKDAVNDDGSIKSQGIDTSFLVATLTAAIQEQQTLITQLTARITALEGA
jgi:hypothetical protein